MFGNILVQAQVNFRHKYVCITSFILEGIFQRLISANQRASFKYFNQWQLGWVSPSLRSLRNKYYHISVSWNLDTVFLLQRSNWNSPRQPGLLSTNIQKTSKLLKIFQQKMRGKMMRWWNIIYWWRRRVGNIFPSGHILIFLTERCKYAHKMLGGRQQKKSPTSSSFPSNICLWVSFIY